MPSIQTVNPATTKQLGSFSLIGAAPTAHQALSDNDDSTAVVFPVTGDNVQVRGVHTLPSAVHRRHRIRIMQRTAEPNPQPEPKRCEWRMQQAGASNPIEFAAFPFEAAFTDWVSSWFFPGSNPFPDFAGEDPITIQMAGKPGGSANPCQTSKVYVQVDCRHQPTFTAEIRDFAGTDQSGGTIMDTNQPRIIIDNVDFDELNAYGGNSGLDGFLFEGPIGSHGPVGITGTPDTSQAIWGGNDWLPLGEEYLLPPVVNGTYTFYPRAVSVIRGGIAFFSAAAPIQFDVDFDPPQTPMVNTAIGGCAGVLGPNVLVCWEVPSPESGGEFFESINVVDVRRTDCNGTSLIYTEEPTTQQEVS